MSASDQSTASLAELFSAVQEDEEFRQFVSNLHVDAKNLLVSRPDFATLPALLQQYRGTAQQVLDKHPEVAQVALQMVERNPEFEFHLLEIADLGEEALDALNVFSSVHELALYEKSESYTLTQFGLKVQTVQVCAERFIQEHA
jgi:hypothetical protein